MSDQGSISSSSKHISVILLISILVIFAIYAIVMFELYKGGKFIFAPYQPNNIPSPTFHPLGNVRPMTQEEIDERNKFIRNS